MDELRQWTPIIIIILANVVAITLSYASLKQKLAVQDEKLIGLEGKLEVKFNTLTDQIDEIKENHLHELKDYLNNLMEKLNQHLINHSK
jgi:hypothetical protein